MLQCNYIDGCLEVVFCSCLMENETVQHCMDSTFLRLGGGRLHVLGSFSKRKKNHENGKFGGGKGWPIFNS